mmetsp:Transcript_1477/g.1712  ORF Transcript_1477/g.1712 Transcript_1477/m.1712 type:complete len:182 (-) Transcript_1477:141-686(-)
MQQQLQFAASILLFWIISIINHIMTRGRRSVHERRIWYTPGLNHPHSSDVNTLIASILGKPLSFMRTGQGRFGHRYDPQQIERASFRDAILELFRLSNLPLFTFGTEPVELEVIFNFNQNYIANDLDNLVKFVMDALQDAHIYDNDVQVMNIKAWKRTGPVAMTQIALHRHVLVVDDDDDE